METHPQERRKRNFTDADLKKLSEILQIAYEKECACRFGDITTEDMRESIKFAKNMNEACNSTKKVIWNTFLVLGTGGFISIVLWGLFHEIYQGMNKVKGLIK